MAIHKVHNLKEGSRPGNWKEYWEKATGLKADKCHRVDCGSTKNIVGGHVQLDDPKDDRWWIVPLCQSCNSQHGAHFSVYGPLVSVTDSNVILY